MKRAALGISAHLGWAATATVEVAKTGIRVLRSDRIETAPASHREAQEPFHVAGGFDGLERVPPPPKPRAVLTRGLGKQRRFCVREISKLCDTLTKDSGHALSAAAILVSRGCPAPSFEKSVGSHTQIHIEEGIAVRDSLARALRALEVEVFQIDAKSLLDVARDELSHQRPEAMKQLIASPPANGGPWRVEERRAALAAWVAWQRNLAR
jgi:hypothetical protein